MGLPSDAEEAAKRYAKLVEEAPKMLGLKAEEDSASCSVNR
jgi:hypothetical protein